MQSKMVVILIKNIQIDSILVGFIMVASLSHNVIAKVNFSVKVNWIVSVCINMFVNKSVDVDVDVDVDVSFSVSVDMDVSMCMSMSMGINV